VANDYGSYRACLRWDFGFTCPFCLLHESDLADATGEAEGSGLMWIEHRLPQSTHSGESNRYENCLYSCRYCNGARKVAPVEDTDGRCLLDPTRTAWADHFELDGERLLCRPGDAHARYTHEAYSLDAPRKVRLRADRARLIEECQAVLREAPQSVTNLLAIAGLPELSPDQRAELIDEVEDLRARVANAKLDLARRAATPRDSDRVCRCLSAEHHELPPALASQMLELELS
jgi:hypothetical protein